MFFFKFAVLLLCLHLKVSLHPRDCGSVTRWGGVGMRAEIFFDSKTWHCNHIQVLDLSDMCWDCFESKGAHFCFQQREAWIRCTYASNQSAFCVVFPRWAMTFIGNQHFYSNNEGKDRTFVKCFLRRESLCIRSVRRRPREVWHRWWNPNPRCTETQCCSPRPLWSPSSVMAENCTRCTGQSENSPLSLSQVINSNICVLFSVSFLFCSMEFCGRKNSHRTQNTLQHAHTNYGTHCVNGP